MFQRDYILRMIEMMGDIARRVAELMEELEYLHQLDDASRLHCGMPLKALEQLSTQSLLELLGPEPRLYASELLYLRAMEPSVRWEQKDALQRKSLQLLASLTDESLLCELRAERLAQLKAAVLHCLTPEELLACAVFFSRGGRFEQMEDALFQAVEGSAPGPGRAALAQQGRELLLAATEAGEETLALCGMTSEELLEAACLIGRLAHETGE